MIDPELVESLRQFAEAAKTTSEAYLIAIKMIQTAAQEDQWMPLDEASRLLGTGISPDMLKERCTDGRFKHGVHFINTSDGKRGNYLVKVSAVRKHFETDPSRRPPRRSV